jgi:hypothetical protein
LTSLGGKYRRLDKLTRMLASAADAYRAADPKDRAKRARIGRTQTALSRAREIEIGRLRDNGTSLGHIGAHLDATDPYRRGVPGNRPVRQARGSL